MDGGQTVRADIDDGWVGDRLIHYVQIDDWCVHNAYMYVCMPGWVVG